MGKGLIVNILFQRIICFVTIFITGLSCWAQDSVSIDMKALREASQAGAIQAYPQVLSASDLLEIQSQFDAKNPKGQFDFFAWIRSVANKEDQEKNYMRTKAYLLEGDKKILLQQESFGESRKKQFEGTESGGGTVTIKVNGRNRILDFYALPMELNPLRFYLSDEYLGLDHDLHPELTESKDDLNLIIQEVKETITQWNSLATQAGLDGASITSLLNNYLEESKFILVDQIVEPIFSRNFMGFGDNSKGIPWIVSRNQAELPQHLSSSVQTMALASSKNGEFNPILVDKEIFEMVHLDQKGIILHETLRRLQQNLEKNNESVRSVFDDQGLRLITAVILVCQPQVDLARLAHRIINRTLYNKNTGSGKKRGFTHYRVSFETNLLEPICDPIHFEKTTNNSRNAIRVSEPGRSNPRLTDYFTLPSEFNPIFDRNFDKSIKFDEAFWHPKTKIKDIMQEAYRLMSIWQDLAEQKSDVRLFNGKALPGLGSSEKLTSLDWQDFDLRVCKDLYKEHSYDDHRVLIDKMFYCFPEIDQKGLILHEMVEQMQATLRIGHMEISNEISDRSVQQVTSLLLMCQPNIELIKYSNYLLTHGEVKAKSKFGSPKVVATQWCERKREQ